MQIIYSNNPQNTYSEDNLSPQKIYSAEKNFEVFPKNPETINSFGGKLGVILLLIFATIIDIVGIILGIIDLGSAGIIGWTMRIIFMILYVYYLIWFWIESNKFGYDYSQIRKFSQKKVMEIKNKTKSIIYSLRVILAGSILANLLPVIGAIIDFLPIETLSVIFLFYLWPKLINNLYND